VLDTVGASPTAVPSQTWVVDQRPIGAGNGDGDGYASGMALPDEKYMVLTTYRQDGTPVATPVWVVPLAGGNIGFWTSSESGKAKRLAHTDRVTVQPSDARGRIKPGSQAAEGTAHLVTGSEFEEIQRLVKGKYGYMTKVTPVVAAVFGTFKRNRIPYGDRGVVVSVTG
jgi:uncharacterized protein